MPTTVQIEVDVGSWLEFSILEKDTGLPITLVERTQIRVFYKKHGELEFTQLTPLVTVVDKNDPQPGENFTEIGFGLYGIYFDATLLDTLNTFTWVVIPDNPGALDFQQFWQQVDIVESTTFIQTIDDINTTVTATATEVTDGFTDNELDHTATQTAVAELEVKVDAMQLDVTEIKNTQTPGIKVSFVEGG